MRRLFNATRYGFDLFLDCALLETCVFLQILLQICVLFRAFVLVLSCRVSDVTCRHSNATEYGLNVCLEQLSQMPRLVESCYVACPSECQLSEWEPWNRCVQGCEGKRFRWRKLLGGYRQGC